MRRRKPLRRYNPKRRTERRRKQYGSSERVQWLLEHPCVSCGGVATDPSHVRHGHCKTADEMVPQCHACHSHLHQHGIVTHQSAYGVDLWWWANHYAAKWREH